jgi:hypothetical protein
MGHSYNQITPDVPGTEAIKINSNISQKRGRKCINHRECAYTYRDQYGRELFTKIRYNHDPCYCGRGKSFAYAYRRPGSKEWIHQKPKPWADWYLYRLDQLLLPGHPLRRKTVYWCEGEKDADRLAEAGRGGIPVDTTQHHQGAAIGATVEQARWLLPARKIVIVADLDPTGAYDAVQRVERLSEAGYAGSLEVVRAAKGNDATDHCDAGYYADQLVPVDRRALRDLADSHRAETTPKVRRGRYTGATR